MKTLRLSCLLAILFAFITLFTNCDPINPPDPKPDPKDTVAVIDSVIIEITLIVPVGATIRKSTVAIINSIISENNSYKISLTNDKVIKMIFINEAKSLIGKDCDVVAGIGEGTDPYGRVCSFDNVDAFRKTIRIQKGVNKVSFEFKCI